MQIIFRKAEPADAPAIARVVTAAWQTAYRGILSDALLNAIDEEKRAERVRETIGDRPEQRYFVLETDGVAAGVSMLCPCRDDDLPAAMEIVVFYVRPDLQGLGLGKAMMRETLRAAAQTGRSSVALWVLKAIPRARVLRGDGVFARTARRKPCRNWKTPKPYATGTWRMRYDGFHGTPV